MPFEKKDPKDYAPKVGLKKSTTGQKSMFEKKPKPPTAQDLQKKVGDAHEKMSGYKKRAAELFIQFSKTVSDKTLPQNRNVFNIESEKEMLQDMIQLAIDINHDPLEQEGMGSLTWITCLFKVCLSQRDRINELEYMLNVLQKKLDTPVLTDFISKEIAKALDARKSNG